MKNKEELLKTVKTTLKLQPIVILYSLVSVASKIASTELPDANLLSLEFIMGCLTNSKLLLIYFFMIADLMIYAFIWQKCIKNVSITVMYANKSSYIFWTQLAAITLFSEHLSLFNLLGILTIFIGILVVNRED